MKKFHFLTVTVVLALFSISLTTFPSPEENIPFLVTFSKQAEKSWGDDDNIQIYFISIPKSRIDPVYIRIFDPEIGGKHDESRSGFNSKTKFTILGGKGCFSDPDAKKQDPSGNFKSGIQLGTKTFGAEGDYDNAWYSFGPYNPTEGEYSADFGTYIIKVVVEGMDGDDGNLYRIDVSSDKKESTLIEGVNSFTYEYCFRTNDAVSSVSHLYPFVSPGVISIRVNTFDYDDEGIVKIVSAAKKGEVVNASGDGKWNVSQHKTVSSEISTSLDVQFIKSKTVNNNNLAVYITDQYGELLPFYASPIGGIPKFKGKIVVKPK
jgi:hypothetical protein